MTKVQPIPKPAKARHFVREWRKHRGLSQEDLAEKIGVTHGAISQLENGIINYTQPMIEALAFALACEPRDLVGRPPDADWGIDHIMARATPDQRRQLRAIALTIVNGPATGTDG